MNHPFGNGVYTAYLWWFGGWFIIVLTTLYIYLYIYIWQVLVSEPGMSMPYGVAVDAERNQVYWTDRKAGRIQRLTLVCQRGVQDLGKGVG